MDDTITKGIIKALLQCPDPLRRLFLDALYREAPEMRSEIDRVQRLSVPYLQLGEARRTTMTGERFHGFRFSAVVITAETDAGDYVAWPRFMIAKMPLHDLQLLELSLSDWLTIVKQHIRSYGKPVETGPARPVKQIKERKEILPDVNLDDYE